MEKNVMITYAIAGGIHTPSLSPDLPITPQQIAHEAIAAAKAGASIIHLHAGDPDKGRPSATAAQTRQRLRLKGGDSVGFYPPSYNPIFMETPR